MKASRVLLLLALSLGAGACYLWRKRRLRIGILVIGSLYWSTHKTRQKWRNDRLRLKDAVSVHAPIRYGRFSKTRTSYTMVLDFAVPTGKAKVVPCRNHVTTCKDLIKEAERLWEAETPNTYSQNNPTISADWGCVVLLHHPDRRIPQKFFDCWAARVSSKSEPAYARDVPNVGKTTGLFQPPWWPMASDGLPIDFDLLLVTANVPKYQPRTVNASPTAIGIADAWRDHPSERHYFDHNIDCDIRTFQDDAILQR